MDSDRALLQAAARAAGVQIVGPVEKYIVQPNAEHIGGFIVRNDRGGDSAWNPLTEDGDALRLAVKLDLMVMIGAARTCSGSLSLDTSEDPYAATRRAIVRAAAAMAPPPHAWMEEDN